MGIQGWPEEQRREPLRALAMQKKCAPVKARMSALAKRHIERMQADITILESRATALCEIRDAIATETVFTSDEQTSVVDALRECEEQLGETREARARAVTM